MGMPVSEMTAVVGLGSALLAVIFVMLLLRSFKMPQHYYSNQQQWEKLRKKALVRQQWLKEQQKQEVAKSENAESENVEAEETSQEAG